jgi:hypothetical protein
MDKPKKQTQSVNWLRFSLVTVGTTLSLVACSTMERSVTLGIASGAALGAGLDYLLEAGIRPRLRISAGVGAAIGGVASYFIHDGLSKRDDNVRRDTLFNLGNHGIGIPATNRGTSPMLVIL